MKLRLLTAFGLALMAAALVLQYRPNNWEPRLTDELLHAPSNHWPRPTLAPDAGTGHFGEIVESDWSALRTLEENWGSIPDATRFECLLATSDLDLKEHFSTPCRQWLEAARRHLPTVERAVAAAEAGPPERFDPLRGADSGHAWRLTVLGRIPAFVALSREAAGEHDSALDACVTALQVIRDLQWGLRSDEYVTGERIGTTTFYPCAHALLEASPERRTRFASELQRIDAGRPPLEHGFGLLRTTQLLHFFGPSLPKKTLARADPKVTAWIARNDENLNPKTLRASWDDFSRYYDGLVEAARQPPERRRLAMNAHRSTWDEAMFKDESSALDAWRSVDAVFDGLKVVGQLADQSAVTHAWPDPLPRGAQTRLSRQNAAAVKVLLSLRTHPVALKDGGVLDLPNEWTLDAPEAWFEEP